MKRNLRILGTMTAGWVALVAFALPHILSGVPRLCPDNRSDNQLPRRRPSAARRAVVREVSVGRALPGTENGWSLFQTRCASCHLNPAVDLATPGTVLREMTRRRRSMHR